MKAKLQALTKASQLKRPRRTPKRLKGKALEVLRQECFYQAQGICDKCGHWAFWETGHMHHKRHKSLGGKDVLSNVQWLCASCHDKHHRPKACPKKERL